MLLCVSDDSHRTGDQQPSQIAVALLGDAAQTRIAASEKQWLYPERRLRSDHWRKLGDGYLLMPDPRHVYTGGETVIGYTDGTSEAFGAYGHRPWQKGYKDADRDRQESLALQRFKAEWAAMYGPAYRGITYHFASKDRPPKTADSTELHEHHLKLDAKFRKQPGERQRRRKLKRSS